MTLRASSGYQYLLCPGSKRMQEGLPEIQTTESVQGTRLHAYKANPEWRRELLVQSEQDLLRLADRLERQIFETIGLQGDYNEFREIKLTDDDGLISGHPDLLRIYVGHEVSVIIDHKFGWTPVVPADTNLQLRIYAILAPTPTVYVAISQPRLPFADRITIAKYTEETKAAARSQIAEILRRTEEADAVLVAGEEQCRYCLARAVCPALRDAVTKQLVVFQDVTEQDLSKRKMLDIVEARLAQASDTQLGGLLSACALARLVYEPLSEEVRRRIAAGKMEGYMLGKETEAREITNPRKAAALLVLHRMLSRDQIWDRAELSITGIEEEYRKEAGLSAKDARADVNKALEDVIEKAPRRPRILRK
jgi:hypothetical protein